MRALRTIGGVVGFGLYMVGTGCWAAIATAVIRAMAALVGRVLYPIPIRFEGPSDEHHPEVDARLEQRFRKAGE